MSSDGPDLRMYLTSSFFFLNQKQLMYYDFSIVLLFMFQAYKAIT